MDQKECEKLRQKIAATADAKPLPIHPFQRLVIVSQSKKKQIPCYHEDFMKEALSTNGWCFTCSNNHTLDSEHAGNCYDEGDDKVILEELL